MLLQEHKPGIEERAQRVDFGKNRKMQPTWCKQSEVMAGVAQARAIAKVMAFACDLI